MRMIRQAQLIQTADSCQERSAPKCAGRRSRLSGFRTAREQPSGIPIWNFEPWLSSLSRALAVGPGCARYLEKQYTPAKFSHNTFRQLQYFMPHKLDFAS